MSPDYLNIPDYVKRRIDFLLQEANNGSPRDQIITFCMRVLSNYASVQMDAGSYKIKTLNCRVSKNAEIMLNNCSSLKEWADLCINEHEVPLKEVWDWLRSNSGNLDSSTVWGKFYNHPMVTITKEEDRKLNANGLRSKSSENRYAKAGIEIVILNSKPYEIFEKINSRN